MKKSTFKKLSHTIYECKYHIVFCSKYRHRILKGDVAEYVKREFFSLAKQKKTFWKCLNSTYSLIIFIPYFQYHLNIRFRV